MTREIDDLKGDLGDRNADLYDAEQRIDNLANALNQRMGVTAQTEKARKEAEAKAAKLGDKLNKSKDKRKELVLHLPVIPPGCIMISPVRLLV